MKSPADWRWITALIGLALIVGTAVFVANRTVEPLPLVPAAAVPAPLPPATGIDSDGLAVAPQDAQPDGLPTDPEQLPPDVQAQPDAGSPAIVTPDSAGVSAARCS